MGQAVKILLIWVLLLAALPVSAELPNNELRVVPVSTELTNSDMAKVVTQYGRPADCLAAVAVYKIDGKKRLLPAQGFLIEPGIHTINGRATLDITHCQFTGSDQQIGSAADLEVNFKAGKTYYIGYDHKSANTEEWTLVVWKIE